MPSTRSRHGNGGRGCYSIRLGDRSARDAGFTLIEVLVAFAVLAIVIVPLLQVFGDGLGTTQTARAYARAALLARSKLAEIGIDTPLEEGELTGTFEEPGYRWRSLVARDDSEVIAPQPPAGSRERRRSRLSESSDASGTGSRSRSSFSDTDRRFARGGSGFGSSSGFGSRSSSGFGSGSSSGSSSGFGSRSSSGLNSSSGLTSQGGSRVGGGGQNGDELLTDEQQLLVYRVMVTVEWGTGAANSLTLSTLRVRRPPDENDDRNRDNSAGDGNGNRSGSGLSRDRTSSFGGNRSGSSGSGFGSFGSRSGNNR